MSILAEISKALNLKQFLSPDPILVLIALTVTLVFSIFQLFNVGKDAQSQKKRGREAAIAREATSRFKKHCEETQESQPKLIRVNDDILVAVGFGASNCALLNGDVLINGLDGPEAAKAAKSAFEKQLGKKLKLKAILLTHFDRDTVGGLEEFSRGSSASVYINEAAEKIVEELASNSGPTRLLNWRRQWIEGDFIDDDADFENLGSGICAKRSSTPYSSLKLPNDVKFISGPKFDLKISENFHVSLFHAPTTRDEHSLIWWSKKEAIFCGGLVNQVI